MALLVVMVGWNEVLLFHLVFDFFLSGGEGGWEEAQKSPTLAAHCPWRRVYVVSVGK